MTNIITQAQYQDRQWYFTSATSTVILDFNNDSINVFSSSHINNHPTATYSSICDSLGRLCIMNDNIELVDSSRTPILNTTATNTDPAAPSTWNGHLILDFPNSDKIVCIRTEFEDIGAIPPFSGGYAQTKTVLTYINKYENNRLGQAIEGKELIQIIDDTLCLPVAACRHANGRDWWVVLRKFRSNKFFIVLITPNGYSVKEQLIGPKLPLIYSVAGKSLFSNDGKTFVFGVSLGNSFSAAPWYFDVFDFDRCSGTFSNQRKINITDPYAARVQGVAISPNNRYLYVGLTRKLFQYDLWASNLDSTAVFIDTAAFNSYVGDMRLAPDGKIYITPSWIGQYLSTIEFPDSAGSGCSYRINAIDLGTPCNAYCFPNMPCFSLGADSSAIGCDTLSTVGLEQVIDASLAIHLYPNPVMDYLHVQTSIETSSLEMTLYDLQGKLILKQKVEDGSMIDMRKFSKGLYYYHIMLDGVQLKSGKQLID